MDIPHRIERYCALDGFAFLREFPGEICLGPVRSGSFVQTSDNPGRNYPVVVAEEFDGNGKVVRSWFILLQTNGDGYGFAGRDCDYQHRIVSRDIKPGVVTPAYDPNAPVSLGHQIPEDQLRRIQAARDQMLLNRERHTIYAQSYIDAVQRASDSEADAKRMQEQFTAQTTAHAAELEQRDNCIVGYRGKLIELQAELNATRRQLREARKRKSLSYRLRLRWRAVCSRIRR
jgi:hypothetical protein